MTAALNFTPDPAANRLLAAEPFALLVGLVLYQQIPVEKAFLGPSLLQERLGGELTPSAVAAQDPDDLVAVFRHKPALHRFPGSMAARVQALASAIIDDFGGDAAVVWEEATDGDDLLARIATLPGFGEYKARVLIGVLVRLLGFTRPGAEALVPDWPSIADVTRVEDLPLLKERKKAWKEAGH